MALPKLGRMALLLTFVDVHVDSLAGDGLRHQVSRPPDHLRENDRDGNHWVLVPLAEESA
jgi:hypothetical protein